MNTATILWAYFSQQNHCPRPVFVVHEWWINNNGSYEKCFQNDLLSFDGNPIVVQWTSFTTWMWLLLYDCYKYSTFNSSVVIFYVDHTTHVTGKWCSISAAHWSLNSNNDNKNELLRTCWEGSKRKREDMSVNVRWINWYATDNTIIITTVDSLHFHMCAIHDSATYEVLTIPKKNLACVSRHLKLFVRSILENTADIDPSTYATQNNFEKFCCVWARLSFSVVIKLYEWHFSRICSFVLCNTKILKMTAGKYVYFRRMYTYIPGRIAAHIARGNNNNK